MASTSVRRLEGKVAIITGAASGIGEATARLFSRHGAKVVIADIQDELGENVAKDLGSSSATFVHCDVSKEADVENAVNTAVSTYGRLDIMVNNAGIAGAAKLSILDNELSEFEQVIKVNLIGAFLGTKHAARVMIPNRSGSIISTASVASTIGGGLSHAYTCSKHGILGLTRNTAVELGNHGIRVNCVSPYLVDTPLSRDFMQQLEDRYGFRPRDSPNLKGAVLTPEDVAEAALYLASDESKYIGNMSKPMLLVSLLLILIITSQFEWRQQLVSDVDTTPMESQKQQQIPQREESVKEKIILSQEKNIQRLNELVRILREQLQQCRSNNETFNGTFSS